MYSPDIVAVYLRVSICNQCIFLYSMKHRRLLLSLPHLPTITETLEDCTSPSLPVYSYTQSGSQSLDDYMASIRALACSVEAPSCGPVRLQRGLRIRPFSKAQMKLSTSPRTLRTNRIPGLTSPEEVSIRVGRERDSRGKDPVDWLYGQRTWKRCFVEGDLREMSDKQTCWRTSVWECTVNYLLFILWMNVYIVLFLENFYIYFYIFVFNKTFYVYFFSDITYLPQFISIEMLTTFMCQDQ